MIKILKADLQEALEDELSEDAVTGQLIQEFEDFVENDIWEWLKENARSFRRKLQENGRL